VEAVASFAEITAREALASGLHIAFAPVADVNSNPRNPIIGIRAFGTEPVAVARHTAAYVRACRRQGLLTTAKHFPGHGNTATDSHAELPQVDSARPILDAIDLPPFEAALEAGAELVMTAHVAFPALDPRLRPATASSPILTDLLRDRMNFKGAVITDSLIMGAIHSENATEQAAALLGAGVDILLDPPDPAALVKGIVQAVEGGLVPRERLLQAYARTMNLKRHFTERFGDSFFTTLAPATARASIGSQAHRDAAYRIARTALEVIGPAPAFSPTSRPGLLAVLIKPYRTHLDPPEEPLGNYLRAFPGIIDYGEVDADTPDQRLDALLNDARKAGGVLAAVVSKPAAWRSFGLPERLAGFMQALVAPGTALLVSLGDPSLLDAYPAARHRVCTYSDVPASQEALAQWLASL
jgi:hypothetical protein